MRTSQQKAELIVGRPLETVEKQLLKHFGENQRFQAGKDEQGKLRFTLLKILKYQEA